MLGGKVHGSLARAGKVKGQTPKVDAEEKKKAKTGRAKRRMQVMKKFDEFILSGKISNSLLVFICLKITRWIVSKNSKRSSTPETKFSFFYIKFFSFFHRKSKLQISVNFCGNLTKYFSTTDDSSMSSHPSARRRAPTRTLNRALSKNLHLQ
jgi:ribosomal protein S30